MKILGNIKGNEVVLNKLDSYNALTLKDRIPSPSNGEIGSIQLGRRVDDYKSGDILLTDGEGWKKLQSPELSVGAVSRIVRQRVGTDVQIRWMDPIDTDKFVWKHTRLLRKYGEYPTSPKDGVVVTDSYTRNYFARNRVYDILPTGTEGGWKYRFFTFSEDEVPYTSDDCCFEPIEFSIDRIPTIVREGNAPFVFALGDIISFTMTNYDNREYDVSFEVAGFNNVTPEDLELKNTVTFVATDVFEDENHKISLSRFDDPWDMYFLTTDVFVTDRTKVYYKKTVMGNFVQATDLRVGQRLPVGVYYELNTNQDRISNGGNRWSASTLRQWLNSTDANDHWSTTPATGGSAYSFAPPLTMFPDEIVSIISPVRNITAKATVDGPGYDMSVDKIYVPSLTEVFDTTHGIYIYKVTTDKSPKLTYEITTDKTRVIGKTYYITVGGAFVIAQENSFNPDGSFKSDVTYYEGHVYYYLLYNGAYRLAREDEYTEEHEFRDDLVYYELDIDMQEENKYLPKFGDTELDSKKKSSSWWLRSAERTTNSTMYYVDEHGEFQSNETRPTDDKHGLVIAFSVA